MSKLTLSVREGDVRAARRKARERGTSISAMFSEWVRAESPSAAHGDGIGPLTRSISGIIKLPEDFDAKEDMATILAEKYGVAP